MNKVHKTTPLAKPKDAQVQAARLLDGRPIPAPNVTKPYRKGLGW